ncbi:selenocysteine lyase/cysteine desulfurase [Kibdelosporangium banguiense]|uniref:Selenocysteine lyase/cysteine desulfurase n=1 Tax=Kibdelosporangium banguiense TaxID=1365924 RepID=A0ABS4TPT2_9PSEU|nr:aminotransferase class V-fold PLP-dependent enzyme [Kibdelosporangium banguiense]MBP2326414.1 selenocysteine lyase/cysteine desulfurase [Kibdelosporangium banguiense]
MNAAEFRARFPMLGHTTHLATCSLGARSEALDDALAGMLDAMAEQGAPWHDFEIQTGLVRQRFADLIGARYDQIALVPNASVGAYQVASTVDLSERRRFVTTLTEFPSISHVWLAQWPRGAQVVHVEGSDYADVIDERTALVSVPMTTYLDSTRMPVADVVSAAHAVGARVFVDAYQAVGVEPVDVDEIGCDFLVAGTNKYLLGLPGVAFLYVRSGQADDLPPQLTGWFGRADPFLFDPRKLDFPAHARRFETGTPPVPALYAANAGLGLISELDPHEVRAHVTDLVSRTLELLAEQGEQVRAARDPAGRGAHVALLDRDPAELARWLAARRIVISPRGDVGRISFHYYNNRDDVHAVCEEIKRYRENQNTSGGFDHAGTG